MTDETQPEALRLALSIDLMDTFTDYQQEELGKAAAELRRQHARITELEAELEAVGAGGVQALSAAPAGFVPVAAFDRLHAHAESLAARLLAAEQQAPKETLGGVNGWRDISTAPKDGSRFVAIGYNYGLYSEGRHICVAQWFRGCWVEASDWNETSELKYLTHWIPLPPPPDDATAPAEQAAPKAAPGEPGYREKWDAELGRTAMRFVDRAGDVHPGIDDAETICAEFHKAMSEVIERMPHVQRMAAPQQEAQEPVAVPRFNCWSTNEGDSWFDNPADAQAIYDCLGNDAKVGDEYELTAGWKSVTARYRITEVLGDGEEYEVECISHPQENTAPQPAPAPLIARSLAEWHEQDGNVAWWAWNGREWAGEPAWIGTPNCEDWPGYHTHWTPAPPAPTSAEGVGS